MPESATSGVEVFDAYVDAVDGSDVPPALSAAQHARLQAEVLAGDVARLEAKTGPQRADCETRLAVLRSAHAQAEAVTVNEYPRIAEVFAEIQRREAKAAAQIDELDFRLVAARTAADDAEAEATRLEAEAPATTEEN